ncbi:MAG: hypothetical protein NZ561_11325 [Phycisphaerae bacterium]|nr:hypothetical protein [Phycisphaerae bacterium]
MNDQLLIFGWLAAIIFSLTIAIPYLMRRSDLLTVWNLFLLGSVNFVGYAAVQTAKGVYHYGLFTAQDYTRLILGTTVFYITIYLVYYRSRLPRRMAGKAFLKWPGYNGTALGVLLALCIGLLFVSVYFPNIQFIGQILIIVGPPAGVIALSLAFCRWWQQKQSLWLLALLGVLLILSIFAAIHGHTGRRSLLSVLLVIPVCLYWLHLRYRPLVNTLVPLGIGLVVGLIVLEAYTAIRHRNNARLVNVAGTDSVHDAIESLRLLPSAMLQLRGLTSFIGGDSMEAALVAIDRYTKVAPPEPFFVLKFVLANPIPRAFWPDKPQALGTTLPRDVGRWRTGYVNWGPGITGHGFHEGGTLLGGLGPYLMLIFYGVLYGLAFRFGDELLLRQSDNPFVLGIFAAASGQIIAFSRGDIALFTVLILGAVLAGLLIKWLGRLLVGYRLIYPSDADRLALEQQAMAIPGVNEEPSPYPVPGLQAPSPFATN